MTRNAPTGLSDVVYPGLVEQREQAAVDRACELASGKIANPIVRDIHPHLDFDDPGTPESAWSGTEPYFIQFSGATPEGEYEVYEIDSDTGNAERRVTVIYGFEAILGADLLTTARIESSDDQTFELPNLQGLDVIGDVPSDRQRLLRSAVAFDVQDNATISFGVEEMDADDEVRVKLLGVTAEKQGRRVGNRS